MEKIMTKKSVCFVFCVGLLTMVSAAAFGQDAGITSAAGDKYVISARAGGVNYTEGTVGIVRKTGRSGVLLKGDELDIGDRVSTGADSRTEILLNPGSYMRVGPNSAFELKTTSLDDLNIRVDSGSAMFEVFASNDFKVSIAAPKAKLTLIESGIYRLDVLADGTAKISVWDGRARLGDLARTEVKKGRSATISANSATVTKFDRGDRDAFVSWSKERGKMLAKATAELKNKTMRSSLISSFNRGAWGLYNSFGLWVHDPRLGRSCFLPFGQGWYSPYGYGYGHSIWWYNFQPVTYQPPVPSIYGTKTRARDEAVQPPPYMKVEREPRQNSPVKWAPDYTTDRPTGPTYVPPPPPVYNAPADTGAKTRP